MSNHRNWIVHALGKTVNAVATELGEDPSNFAKKVKAGLPAEKIIQISYHYDLDPVQSLTDTGFLRDDPREPESPEDIQRRIHSDLEKLDSAWRNRMMSGQYDGPPLPDGHSEADLIDFPTPTGIYADDDEEEMPEDAVAYGKQEWGDPDGDNDY